MVGKGQKIRRCTMGLAWERTGTSDRKVTRCVLQRWAECGDGDPVVLFQSVVVCAKYERRGGGKMPMKVRYGGPRGLLAMGCYPGKGYFRVGASGAATSGILRYTKS